jgi:hypothetical protein
MAELDIPGEDKEKIYYKNAQTLGSNRVAVALIDLYRLLVSKK